MTGNSSGVADDTHVRTLIDNNVIHGEIPFKPCLSSLIHYTLLCFPWLPVTTGGGCPAHGSQTLSTVSLTRC